MGSLAQNIVSPLNLLAKRVEKGGNQNVKFIVNGPKENLKSFLKVFSLSATTYYY